ncbi:MAG: hypothetical protein K6E37_07705 [Bacteroidales bacterium]|jgi:hypothetical protein|nr:hypothetical protein [Bacteroidales bacterium]
MGATIIVAAAVLGLGVLGMCFNILFRGRDFPHYDVGSNEEMRKRGIRCYKDEDAALHQTACDGNYSEACKECKLYESRSDSRTS